MCAGISRPPVNALLAEALAHGTPQSPINRLLLAAAPPVTLECQFGTSYLFQAWPRHDLRHLPAALIYAVCTELHMSLLHGGLPDDVVEYEDGAGCPRHLRIVYIGQTKDASERHAPGRHEHQGDFDRHQASVVLMRRAYDRDERAGLEARLIARYNPVINELHRTR